MKFGRKWRDLGARVEAVNGEIAWLRDEAARRATETEAIGRALASLEERLSAVDGRLTHIAEALTNQLHELDAEIERLSATTDAAGAEAVGELRANQVRIANEQARYAIALRQDIAELGELLRRARG